MVSSERLTSIMNAQSGFRPPSIDPSSDYSRIERKPSHKWTVSHHLTLAFLASLYENSWKELTIVFNAFFSNELGHPDGLSSAALASMYHDMKRGRTGKDAMGLLQRTAFPFVSGPTCVDQNAIEQTATELGIQLIKRPLGAPFKGLKPLKMLKRKAVALDEDTDFLSEHESSRRAPKKRQHPEPLPQTPDRYDSLGACDGLITPPATISQQLVPPPKRLPLVTYRAFSCQSQGSFSKVRGFCAGAFVDSDNIPLPPHPQSQEYIDEAKRVR